jgi:glycosyltransferase involved in cell wall biosynthesis
MLIWNGILEQPPRKTHKISFVTTVMQRLGDLQQTLPVNLQLNAKYPALEFVLVDYNSKDGLGAWVRKNLMGQIEAGRVVYVRTDEPTHFSMAHSRNIGCRVASGDIVLNVDADNFTRDMNGATLSLCFAEYINLLANQQPRKAFFAKGKQLLHGRIGYYKDEFIDLLGGYDEDMVGYGWDDVDVLERAMAQGFMLMRFGGQYYSRLKTPDTKKNENLLLPWKVTEQRNKKLSEHNYLAGRFMANRGRSWGAAHLVKNFTEEINL